MHLDVKDLLDFGNGKRVKKNKGCEMDIGQNAPDIMSNGP